VNDVASPGADTREQALRRSRNRSLWLRRGLGALFVLVVGAAIGWAWMPKPVPVDLTQASRGELEVSIDEDGRTRVKDRYRVSAPLLANLARIELHPGDAVQPGTVLARLVPLSPPLLDARTRAGAEAQVAAAAAARSQALATIGRVQTSLEFARSELARQRQLSGTGATSARSTEQAELQERTLREELASAQFGAKVAENQLRVAQASLGRLDARGRASDEQLEITAPVAGRVLQVLQESEGVVQPGTPLLELGDPAALELVVDVLTSDAVHVRPGTPVRIERWGGDYPLRAHVRLVEPSAFTRISALGVEEQRVNLIVDLDEPSERWAALGDGYRVEAHVVLWHGADVLRVPAGAVFRRGDGWAVFAAAQGKAKLAAVKVGRRNAQHVEILEGLEQGAQVVVHPSDRVVDGASIAQR
jgi:HlyD family secretion protein